MFKQIPKSNISEKNFKVYKEWAVNQATVPVITATNENVLFDLDTSTKSQGLYVSPLYNSIKAKYYSSFGNLFTQYGLMTNPADWDVERYIGDTIYIIQLPQSQYGEEIKPGSVVLEIGGNIYVDNSWGGLVTENPAYELISYDAETQLMTLTNGVDDIEITVSYLDMNSGIGTFTIDGITDSNTVFQIDFNTGFIELSNELLFTEGDFSVNRRGNVFYDDGLIILTSNVINSFTDYNLTYNSTQTIYETEVLVSAEREEFNASQNPTAVDVVLRNSYDFETTKITNYKPAGTVRIKEVQDISQKQSFVGSVGSTVGTWNDYYEYGTSDPTGSYLSTYITTIGLYDKDLNMVAVAKLPKPIKKLPDYNLNFIIRFDT